ncbi:hypothetical protein MRB53_035378 [Persea americana]|uniref:Uncharacterized protein n=1 Tax=Persea americana TaxID=3435 RepID=A0ACC2K4I3_PERAE|nr:hypothetical protein MRB53_035378 [Persea americana]
MPAFIIYHNHSSWDSAASTHHVGQQIGTLQIKWGNESSFPSSFPLTLGSTRSLLDNSISLPLSLRTNKEKESSLDRRKKTNSSFKIAEFHAIPHDQLKFRKGFGRSGHDLPSSSSSDAPAPSPDSGGDSPPPDAPSPSPPATPSPAPSSGSPAPFPSPDASPPAPEAPGPAPVSTPSPAPVPAPNGGSDDGPQDISGGSNESSSRGLKAGQKAGIALGVIVGVGIVGVGGFVYKKRQENIRRSRYGYAARGELL